MIDLIKIINSLNQSREFLWSWPNQETRKHIPTTEKTEDGVYKTGNEITEPKSIKITGAISEGKREETIAKKDEIIAFLNSAPLKIFPSNEDRFLYAYLQNFNSQSIGQAQIIELELIFLATDPFFYSEIKTEEKEGKNVLVEVENEGNKKGLINFEIEFLEEAPMLQVINQTTEQTLEVEYNFELGQTLRVNNQEQIIRLDDKNILNSVNEKWLVNELDLTPGVNEIEFNGVEAKFKVLYQSRWF